MNDSYYNGLYTPDEDPTGFVVALIVALMYVLALLIVAVGITALSLDSIT